MEYRSEDEKKYQEYLLLESEKVKKAEIEYARELGKLKYVASIIKKDVPVSIIAKSIDIPESELNEMKELSDRFSVEELAHLFVDPMNLINFKNAEKAIKEEEKKRIENNRKSK